MAIHLTEPRSLQNPSVAASKLEEWDRGYTWHPFAQTAEREVLPPLRIARGDGCWLQDANGKRYLDGYASMWTNVHGHGVPALRQAISDQLERVAHSTYLGLAHDTATFLAKRLVDSSPQGLQRVFYSDNGSTAVEVALKHSLCSGLYREGEQIGLARLVTDYARFGYLLDVFVLEAFRGQGLGKWLISCVFECPSLRDLTSIGLATRDAHSFYEAFGWERQTLADHLMKLTR